MRCETAGGCQEDTFEGNDRVGIRIFIGMNLEGHLTVARPEGAGGHDATRLWNWGWSWLFAEYRKHVAHIKQMTSDYHLRHVESNGSLYFTRVRAL